MSVPVVQILCLYVSVEVCLEPIDGIKGIDQRYLLNVHSFGWKKMRLSKWWCRTKAGHGWKSEQRVHFLLF